MKKFITILVVLVLSAVSFGAVTVYSDYDTGTTFTYTLDPQVGGNHVLCLIMCCWDY